MYSSLPWKSSATISASSVGETDIQIPSKYTQYCAVDVKLNESDEPVVPNALPAKDVSRRWFRVKLFPTDCSPIDDTTFTG